MAAGCFPAARGQAAFYPRTGARESCSPAPRAPGRAAGNSLVPATAGAFSLGHDCASEMPGACGMLSAGDAPRDMGMGLSRLRAARARAPAQAGRTPGLALLALASPPAVPAGLSPAPPGERAAAAAARR